MLLHHEKWRVIARPPCRSLIPSLPLSAPAPFPCILSFQRLDRTSIVQYTTFISTATANSTANSPPLLLLLIACAAFLFSQEDFAGDPDGSFAGLGPSPVAAGSLTFQVPSAGPGAYSVAFFRNSTEPVSTGLVPPGGAILARYAFTILSLGQGLATFNPPGNVPPDIGAFVVGNQGLVCPAGSRGLPDPTEVKGGWPPCTLCPVGSYTATYGTTLCTKCPQGQVTAGVGAVGCILCPATLVAGSPLLLPENAVACTACGFCCTNACRAAVSGISVATSSVDSNLMSVHIGTTPVAWLNKTRAASQQNVTSPITAVTSLPILQTATAGRPDATQIAVEKTWTGICGNMVRELYDTDCWYVCPPHSSVRVYDKNNGHMLVILFVHQTKNFCSA